MADYKEMAQSWYSEVMSEGKTEVIDELCAPDFVDHDPLPGTTAAGLKDFVAQIRAAFPDMQVTAEDMIAEGDQLAIRSTMRGTHEGDFMGIPGSGKKVEVSNYDFVRSTRRSRCCRYAREASAGSKALLPCKRQFVGGL
jgi:steroid delta-isomerase-like uncharacterized protein